MILLLKWWKEAAIVVLLVFLWGEWTAHNRAEQAKGAAEVRWHLADSTLKVLQAQAAKIDTEWVHDTVKFTVTKLAVKTLHDTLNIHDTTQVKVYIERATAAINSCTDLMSTCQAKVANLEAQLAAERSKTVVAPLVSPRSCFASNSLVGVVGVGLGFLAGRH